MDRGMTVFPYRWKDEKAQEFARQQEAILAVGRLEAKASSQSNLPTLSPSALLRGNFGQRIVLPSPNGSTITTRLDEAKTHVIAGCLRNASAVAEFLQARLELGESVAIIAAGERWPSDGSLRPAIEDYLGVGVILSELTARGFRELMTPEASCADDLYVMRSKNLSATIRGCASALELQAMGFEDDVDVALERNSSSTVPVLDNGAIIAIR
ncbi:hypothetical protein AUR04nite_31090 [Glutamicibacter uratoxydans]|uniref:Probable 2-phosphosulfolactate phosphatase n=2 Tax=Glutamicibacter uratoxydans TaxID=43667 RepID=A0A4Y4DSG6_GLUUR|nr:hypothetical protein AUR04nite_31090 [Glutamicibacter uratoxydans]